MVTEEGNEVTADGSLPAVYTRSNYFAWSDEKKYTLAKLVNKNMGYKKTDTSMKLKFEIIHSQLLAKPGFESLSIQPLALQNKFRADMDMVLSKYGISKDNVNLSGLDGNEPSEYEKLIIDMAEASYKDQRKRKSKAQAAHQRKKICEELTKEGLQVQGERSVSSDLLMPSSVESSITDDMQEEKLKLRTSTKSSSSIALLENLSKTIAESIAASSGNSGADIELDREVKRAQIAASKAQELYFLKMLNGLTSTNQ